MSVFTTVTPAQMDAWLGQYPLGRLLELKGIASGITNTNYFVTTEQGRYVLTLFEKNAAEELPAYLELMAYLADHGIPSPHPIANRHGAYLGELNGKPASLVSCLSGASVEAPTVAQCAAMGAMLARLHLAGQQFPAPMPNLRGLPWALATSASVLPHMPEAQRRRLQDELAYQAGCGYAELPRGVIHADLFRDNVLFEGDEVSGLIDFYYACHDALAYDLAITVNDWCVDAGGRLDRVRAQAMLAAYHALRPLTAAENRAWHALLRAAALRFWVSRLYDFYHPQPGEMTHAKDPEHFYRILCGHIDNQHELQALPA